MTTMNTPQAVNESLRARLADPRLATLPPARPEGEPLPLGMSRFLDGLIERHPGESHVQIARRFAVATGTRIDRLTVQRQRPTRSDATRRPRLTPDHVAVLRSLILAYPDATRPELADLFAAATGWAINRRTVGVHARRLHGAGGPTAEDWPSWTDEVTFTLTATVPATKGGVA